jgi:uncharacterized protein YdeI (YjbR/CyaY-like superfamily)
LDGKAGYWRYAVDVTETLYVTNRDEWRDWLEKHWKSASEIWLVSYLKRTGKPSVPYNDAVEEALCFGWIDSIIKKLDQERNVQRFSPRKSKSNYSQTNKERLKRLIEQGKVIPEVLDSLSEVDLENFDYPIDILTVIRENKQAWKNYQKYSESYRRIRVAYIDLGRKRPGEFEKRLQHFIRKTEKDQQFGFGIEDYF